jgi:hypothetical protein
MDKKAALALPWEKIISWSLLFLFAIVILWFFSGPIMEMINNIIKNIFK